VLPLDPVMFCSRWSKMALGRVNDGFALPLQYRGAASW
jgi:hypothetical protein